LQTQKAMYDDVFFNLNLSASKKVSGQNCKKVLANSGLPGSTLKQIWTLAGQYHLVAYLFLFFHSFLFSFILFSFVRAPFCFVCFLCART
jgi:hypothetical protein